MPLSPVFRLLTAPLRMFPDFIIPGEAKCGTTSFYRYLCEHPRILAADCKEPHSFIRYGASPMFCRRHFPLRRPRFRQLITGEATANYLSTPGVSQAIRAVVPEVRLIVLMRDPVARAFSDHQMMIACGAVREPFDEGIHRTLDWLETPSLKPLVDEARQSGEGFLRFIFKGDYADHLESWLRVFQRERFLFIESESLFENPQHEVARAFRFLGLREISVSAKTTHKQGTYQETWMRADTESRLRAFYAPRIRRLEHMLDRSFRWLR